MPVGITALGSGSRGNAFVIHSSSGDILVDAGFSRKDLLDRMEKTGVNPAAIKALLLTHEHDDHARGCRVFCDALNIPACASYHTSEYLQKKQKMPNTVMEFSPGTIFEVAGFQVSPFSVQHDAIDPVGFVITKSGVKIGIATDLGTVNGLALQRLRDCHILVLESNYDHNMLRNSNRQYYLQKRIMGRHGHLNNTDAFDALPELISGRTVAIFLVHVSSECNSYDLVRTLGAEKLAALGRNDIRLQVVEQSAPLPTVWVEESEDAVVELFSEPAKL